MLKSPSYAVGATIEYKSGKRGYHWGFDNDQQFVVAEIHPPVQMPSHVHVRRGEFGGWTVRVWLPGAPGFMSCHVPCAWFRVVLTEKATT